MTELDPFTWMLVDELILLMKVDAFERTAPAMCFLVTGTVDAAHALQAQIAFAVWLAKLVRHFCYLVTLAPL